MAKAAKVLCDRCESKIVAGVPFCNRCGCPTQWASHEQRVGWELSQWKTADRSQSPASQDDASSRRWIPRPFGRKASTQPTLTLVPPKGQPEPHLEPTVAAEPVAVSTPVEPRPEPKPAPALARTPAKPIARPPSARTPKIERRPRDGEPLRDLPATVMAMRLLNARVAELEARIQQLEAALADRRRGAERIIR